MLISCLLDLPPSLKSFSAGMIGLYDDELVDAVEHLVSHSARHLTEFSLLDVIEECPQDGRGVLDLLVSSLVNVRKLTISPTALSDLTDVLGPLVHLKHLVLALREVDAYALEMSDDAVEGGFEFSAREVVDLIDSCEQLKRLDVLSATQAGWSAKERKAVERAARRQGIRLRWVTSETTDEWPYVYPPV